MGKMNEIVGEKNNLENCGGKKQLVCHFTTSKLWKFIGCTTSEVNYGIEVTHI